MFLEGSQLGFIEDHTGAVALNIVIGGV